MRLYVISEHRDGPVKIGFADRVENRLSQIQGGNPRGLALEFSMECANYRLAERIALHRAGHTKRLCGEWFSISVAEAISVVKQACYLANQAERRQHGWLIRPRSQ